MARKVEGPTSLSGVLSPVTILKADLELSPTLKIKVWAYKKTSEERLPSLKQHSDKALPTGKFATHEVGEDMEYKCVDDPLKVGCPEQRIKGYLSSAEGEGVKFKQAKGLKLLGFTDASTVTRYQGHDCMKDVRVFIADQESTKAILAVSALARVMEKMNKIAILRWRQGQKNFFLGALIPFVSDKDNIPDLFYFNQLCFADLNEQRKVMFDLAPFGKEAPNPILELFYQYLNLEDAVVGEETSKDRMQNTCILTLCFREEDNNIGLLVAADSRRSKMLVAEQNNAPSRTRSAPFQIPRLDTWFQNELVGDDEEKLYRVSNEIWMGIAGRLGFGKNIVKSLQSMYEKSSKRSVEMVAKSCFDLAKLNHAEWKQEQENENNPFAFSALVFGFDVWGPQNISDPRVFKIHYKFSIKKIIKDLQTELFADAGSGGDFGMKFLRDKYKREKKGITDFKEALDLLKAACKEGCDSDFSTGPKFEILVMKKKQMKTKIAVTVEHVKDECVFVKNIM